MKKTILALALLAAAISHSNGAAVSAGPTGIILGGPYNWPTNSFLSNGVVINFGNSAGKVPVLDGGGYLVSGIFPAFTGDVTKSAGSLSLSLQNVGTAGTYGDATHTLTIITDAKGRVSSASANTITPAGIGAEASLGNPGTNGYVLSSTTGGVRSWVAMSGGGSVATDTIFDAKGDLAVGTGSDTAARLAIGANDTIAIADSSQTTGIRWGNAASIKTALSLGNVENTALSSWTGSANIATVGTVTTGTWNGTAIADTYIVSASTWNAKVGPSRTISTTSPLLGGGDLSANRTFSLAGLTGLGTANQILGMNNAATAYEYKSVAVGTSGSDFAIAHSAGGITLNLPTASASNRGAISTSDWSAFNAKQSALTFSGGVTNSGGTVTVDAVQNITRLSGLTTNGFVKTGSSNGTLSIDSSTYLTTNQSITLSGDVSGTGATSITTAIGANVVTNAKSATMAAGTIKGNNTGGASNPLDLTVAQVQTMLSPFPVANGGTGQTSYTNGQLLIGNTTGNTLTKATLTGAANQIQVANSTGSITLSLPAALNLAGKTITTSADLYFVGATTFSETTLEYPLRVINYSITASQGLATLYASSLANGNTVNFLLGRSLAPGGVSAFGFTPQATFANNRWGISFYAVNDVFNVFEGGGASLGLPGLLTNPGAGSFVMTGNLGVGTNTPSARIHGIATTEQMRLGYDASNYYSTTVSSAGAVTLNAFGASAGFTFSDPITGSLVGNSTTATTLQTPRTINAVSFNGSANIDIKGVVGTAAFDAGLGAVDNLVVKGIIDDVTYNGVGDYQVVFAAAEPDINYSALVIPDADSDYIGYPKEMDTNGFKARVRLFSSGAFNNADINLVRVVVFRMP